MTTQQGDRELLQAAAKAAGIALVHKPFVHNGPGGTALTKGGYWNPLTDDGDALRLAVKLNMGVKCNEPGHWDEPNCTIVILESDCARRIVVKHGKDKTAATRRAIVRAAAAISRAGESA